MGQLPQEHTNYTIVPCTNSQPPEIAPSYSPVLHWQQARAYVGGKPNGHGVSHQGAPAGKASLPTEPTATLLTCSVCLLLGRLSERLAWGCYSPIFNTSQNLVKISLKIY